MLIIWDIYGRIPLQTPGKVRWMRRIIVRLLFLVVTPKGIIREVVHLGKVRLQYYATLRDFDHTPEIVVVLPKPAITNHLLLTAYTFHSW